jgi:hypothetical protein
MRPAFLGVEELDSGALRVVWKVPAGPDLPPRFGPVFPEAFKTVPPKERVATSTARIETWTLVTGGAGLRGATLGIEGLEETTIEALLRIEFVDGSVHRTLLRPTTATFTVPESSSESAPSVAERFPRFLQTGHWRYPLLLGAAWALSFGAGARRRGILLCSLALVAGSVCGHALGGASLRASLQGSPLPSDPEIRQVLRGLLLNTYRAFMLDQDEEVYDVLARSVAGEFLNEVYLQNREALSPDNSEDAMSLVNRLDVRSIESLSRAKDGTITLVAEWDVYGSVLHWDHIHFRCNAYKAELRLVPMDGYWKLTRLQLLDGKRVI